MYSVKQLKSISCGSSLGVVTACLLCARVLHSPWFKEIQKRPARRPDNDGETCAPSYDVLNLNLFLSHGRQAEAARELRCSCLPRPVFGSTE